LPGSSKREGDNFVVDLVSAPTQAEELNYIVGQLQRWHKQGYEWHDMAVLCRSKQPVSDALVAACCGARLGLLAMGANVKNMALPVVACGVSLTVLKLTPSKHL
jgi:hypothetical protein